MKTLSGKRVQIDEYHREDFHYPEEEVKGSLKELFDFINEEKRMKDNDDRHIEGFREGFKSSCIIIKERVREIFGGELIKSQSLKEDEEARRRRSEVKEIKSSPSPPLIDEEPRTEEEEQNNSAQPSLNHKTKGGLKI